jgi:ABC-2 type transport system permease protein
LLVLLAIPVLMTAIIGAIFAPSADNKLPKIKVLVVDKDKNIAAKFLLGAFDLPELKDMFQVTMVDEIEGKKLMAAGKASAMVVIPEKFSNRFIKAEKSEILVIKNPSEQFLPNVVEEFMVTYAVIMSCFIQVFEPELKTIYNFMEQDTPLEQVSIASMTPFLEQGKNKITALKNYLSPLLIQLKAETTGEKKQETGFNIFSYVLPGMSIMFLLFIIETFIRDILVEREDGKWRRMMFSPLRPMEFISARVISGWLMGIAVYLVIVLFGLLVFKIDWGNYLYLFIFVTVTCAWIASFFALLNSFFKNRNQAGAFTAPIILVFSAFGGSIISVNQLPAVFQWVSYITLNRWFIDGVDRIRSGIFPLIPFTVLFLSGLVLFLLASTFLKRRITV